VGLCAHESGRLWACVLVSLFACEPVRSRVCALVNIESVRSWARAVVSLWHVSLCARESGMHAALERMQYLNACSTRMHAALECMQHLNAGSS
jgi:hypothetical protein